MFKKAFESFFIIDANEKPAPSFLAAYLIAWFFVHKQVVTTFISTTGAIDIRLSASLASITENLYMQAFWWAIAFVIIRFGLNNLIYFIRESFDHLTQFSLNSLNMKSFIKTSVHQVALDDLANARGKLHSFHDRATQAEESESKIKMDLQALKIETKTQLQDSQDSLVIKENELDEQLRINSEVDGKYVQFKENLDISNEELRQSSSANDQLKVEYDKLKEDYNLMNVEFTGLRDEQIELENTHKNLVIDYKELTKNYDKSLETLSGANEYSDDLMAKIKIMNQETSNVLDKQNKLTSDLNESNYFKENINNQVTKWAKNTNQPKLKLLGRNESDLSNYEKIELNKLLASKVFNEETSNQTFSGLNSSTNNQFGQMTIPIVKPEYPMFSALNSSTNNQFGQMTMPIAKPEFPIFTGLNSSTNNQFKHSPRVVTKTLTDKENNTNKTKNSK